VSGKEVGAPRLTGVVDRQGCRTPPLQFPE
jgi:hypothetical protein